MATPGMKVQPVSKVLNYGTADGFRVNTIGLDGAPIDVSSGYTLRHLKTINTNNANPSQAAQDFSSNVTATFDSTGLSVAWTAAQASTIFAAQLSTQNSFQLTLSNDSGTTESIAASGSLNLNPQSLALN